MFNKIKGMLKSKYNDKINIDLIKSSNLFSSKYYLFENSEVKIDPAKHYYYRGFKEGKSPSYDFSNNAYLRMYKDVRNAGINPLVHYLKYGKRENRRIVKDNGDSIAEIYYNTYGYFYNYNFYYVNDIIKRVNFFIDDYIEFDYHILKILIEYCKKNEFSLRIVYRKFDISTLKEVISNCNINIEYIYLNSNDYIFIGDLEYIICNGYKTAFALINSNLFDNKVFLYLNKYEDSYENNFIIMFLYNNPNVYFLTNNNNIKINVSNLIFKCNGEFKNNKMYFYNKNSFVLGLILLNYIFLNGIYDSQEYSIHAVNNNIKYHLDTDVITYNIKNKEDYNSNYLFYLTDDISGNVIIGATIEKIDKQISFILIDSDNLLKIDSITKNTHCINNIFYNFEKSMKKVKGGKEDV